MRSFSILFVAFIFCFAIGNLKGRYLLVEVDQETEPTSVSFRSGDTKQLKGKGERCGWMLGSSCGECADSFYCKSHVTTIVHCGICTPKQEKVTERVKELKKIGESCKVKHLPRGKDCGECAESLNCQVQFHDLVSCGICTLKLEKSAEKAQAMNECSGKALGASCIYGYPDGMCEGCDAPPPTIGACDSNGTCFVDYETNSIDLN